MRLLLLLLIASTSLTTARKLAWENERCGKSAKAGKPKKCRMGFVCERKGSKVTRCRRRVPGLHEYCGWFGPRSMDCKPGLACHMYDENNPDQGGQCVPIDEY